MGVRGRGRSTRLNTSHAARAGDLERCHEPALENGDRVCPLTLIVHRVCSCEVFIPVGDGPLERDSKAQSQLLRAVDKQRLQGFIGVVSPETLALVTEAIAVLTEMRDSS